jgi:hypothetical protein
VDAKQFKELKTNNMIYVDKNRIYFDKDELSFVVEIFEFEDNGVAMYSVLDAFCDFEKAFMAVKNPGWYLQKLERGIQ